MASLESSAEPLRSPGYTGRFWDPKPAGLETLRVGPRTTIHKPAPPGGSHAPHSLRSTGLGAVCIEKRVKTINGKRGWV